MSRSTHLRYHGVAIDDDVRTLTIVAGILAAIPKFTQTLPVANSNWLGPEDCFAINQRLVCGRVTGWGQTGPLASVAGHDLDYIAL